MEWYVWVAIGVICMILEIFSFGFYFFAIGSGAIITGVFAGFANIYVQIIIFVISTTISFFCMNKFAGLFKTEDIDSNIFALIGQNGFVTADILPGKKGYVKLENEEWRAIAEDPTTTLLKGTQVKVVKSEGNKVIVVFDGIKKEEHLEKA